jgi:hypothetical protein
MPNKIIKTEKGVSVRIDDAYTTNEKHFLVPYVKQDGTESFFGSFKFLDPKEAQKTLKDAVKALGAEDTVFEGQYPKWETDNYGSHLKVNNKVKFYQSVDSKETIPDLEVRDYVYSIEIQLSKTKDNQTYLRVARAIALKETTPQFNDELYEDLKDDMPFDI